MCRVFLLLACCWYTCVTVVTSPNKKRKILARKVNLVVNARLEQKRRLTQWWQWHYYLEMEQAQDVQANKQPQQKEQGRLAVFPCWVVTGWVFFSWWLFGRLCRDLRTREGSPNASKVDLYTFAYTTSIASHDSHVSMFGCRDDVETRKQLILSWKECTHRFRSIRQSELARALSVPMGDRCRGSCQHVGYCLFATKSMEQSSNLLETQLLQKIPFRTLRST